MYRPTLALVAVLAVGLAYGLAACGDASPLIADADWTYVGDGACQQCHSDLAASYARTGMGKAVSLFDPETAPEIFGPDGTGPTVCADDGYCYQPFVRGDTLYQRETRPDTPGYERVHAASHVVGSGHATRSYFMEAASGDGDYLTEMPLTWYVEREIWDLSPGYQQINRRFDRPITLDCMTCHNGLPGHETSQNFYTEVPLGISCERCHGPGSAHVAAYESGGAPSDPQIVNPASLDTDLQLDVCQQCHLTGETVYAPGEDATTYRPGRPLAAHRSVFVTRVSLEDPEAFGIASHAERMQRSACFTESVGTETPLTCTTCHDPHVATSEKPADHFNQTCQSCHGPSAHLEACSRPEVTSMEESVSGDCVSCHMRSGGTSDIPHVSFTDHWIRRDPPPPTQGITTGDGLVRETPFQLVEMTGAETEGPEAEIVLALATLHLYETKHRLPEYLPGIARRIREGLAAGVERTDARVGLGRALFEMDSLASAQEVLSEAVARDAAAPYAHFWLGVVEQARGRHGAAADALREAVRLAPTLSEARVQLGSALSDAGRLDDAVDALSALVERDPLRHPNAWNDLGFAQLRLGNLPGALSALRRAVALDPRLGPARVNLGAALLASGDVSAARAQFEAALRINPDDPAALGNLGLVLAQLGQTQAARERLQRVLDLDPTDARARAALDALP
ncbi:MAG: tetratricopeptide repeat protein [Bacteroidota bacterium]